MNSFGMTIVRLKLEHRPVFPNACVGCGRSGPSSRWTYDQNYPPFAGTAYYYAARGWLPPLAVPVCRLCRDLMPKDVGFWTGYAAPWQVWFIKRVSRWMPNFVWRLGSWRLDSPNDQAFNLLVEADDFVDYYFRSEQVAAEFARLNGVEGERSPQAGQQQVASGLASTGDVE